MKDAERQAFEQFLAAIPNIFAAALIFACLLIPIGTEPDEAASPKDES